METSAQKIHTILSVSENPLIVVAGGASFLGSFLCEELLKLSCRVLCVDNLSSGKKENLTPCFNSENFFLLEKNLNEKDLARIIKKKFGKVSYIFHLAPSDATNLLEIAKDDGAKFLLVSSYTYQEAKRYAEVLVTECFKKFHLDARIVRIKDVYGPRMNFKNGNLVAKLLEEVVMGKALSLSQDGLAVVHPTFVKDVVSGILSAMFKAQTCGHIFNLVNPEPVTLLNLARETNKQQEKDLEIVFTKESSAVNTFPQTINLDNQLGWKPKTTLAEGLKETINWGLGHKVTGKEPSPVMAPVIEENWSKKLLRFMQFGKKTKLLLGGLLLFIVFLIWPFLSFGWETKSGINNWQKVQELVVAGKILEAQKKVVQAKNNFMRGQKQLTKTAWLFNLTGKQKQLESFLRLVVLAQKGSDSMGHLLSAASFFDEAGKIIMSSSASGVLVNKLASGKNELEIADEGLSFLQAELALGSIRIPEMWFLGKMIDRDGLNSKLTNLTAKFVLFRQYVSQARVLVQMASNILGVSGKRTYLLLFANNMELRPAGGFIGSYGLLTLTNGRLTDFKIEDVYSADGQLTGHVEPPGPIRKYLDQPHWYLRDSNWSPDFRESSSQAEWFLEKEVGQRVDGTIMIDLNTAQNLLAALGPVYLPDYQETIDQNNLFEKASYYSESNFFPGSSQKRDFLGALARKMVDQIIQRLGTNKGFSLTSSLFKSATEKHFSLYFHDEELENVINQFNLGGGIGQDPCLGAENCLGDYLLVVNANLGVNKANYFVKQNIVHKIFLDKDGKVTENLTINYNNTSTKESWPGGTYKDFLRILVPDTAQLINIQTDGQDVGSTSVEEASQSAKTSFGFLVNVPAKTQKTVSISYGLKNTLSFLGKNQYKLLLQKQLGSQADDYKLEINYPEFLDLVKTNLTPTKAASGLVSFSLPLESDMVFSLEFKKK